jgi:dihydroorotase-like cyclic amidohydrolase
MRAKGRLAVAADADVTLVDLNREWVIDSEKLHSRNHVTPFDGWRGKGQAVATIVRGQVVMENGQLTGTPQGKMVRPSPVTP